jgi:hypothetical protein
MTMKFASQTSVPVERSRAEIEKTLLRYGASEFQSGWRQESAMIGFQLGKLFIRFVLPLPSRSEKRFTHKTDRYNHVKKRSEDAAAREYDQEVRQRWRALLLTIKAKLEAVECGISSIESEFLAFIVMPNQVTVGDWFIDQALPCIAAGEMPRLALAAPKDDKVDE